MLHKNVFILTFPSQNSDKISKSFHAISEATKGKNFFCQEENVSFHSLIESKSWVAQQKTFASFWPSISRTGELMKKFTLF